MLGDRWSDQFWLRMAKHYADEGKDPSTKVGAVLVRPDRTAASWGVNGFPMGIADTEERLNNRDLKLALTVHAEMNAFAFLRERAIGMTLYSTFAPCFTKCAPVIVQNRVGRVVFYTSDNPRWREEQAKSVDLFSEAGIPVTGIDPVTEFVTFSIDGLHENRCQS